MKAAFGQVRRKPPILRPVGACERALAVSLPFLRALAVSPPSFSPSSSAPHSSSRFAPRTQKKWQVAGFLVVGEVGSRFGNIVGLTFQARPFHGLRVAGAADNHFLAANNNHDVADPGSRITSDGNLRRSELLGHDGAAKKNVYEKVVPPGITGDRRPLLRQPGAPGGRSGHDGISTNASSRSCGACGAKGKFNAGHACPVPAF